MDGDLAQRPHLFAGQDQIIPGCFRLDPLRQFAQPRIGLRAASLPYRLLQLRSGFRAGLKNRGRYRFDLLDAQVEMRHHLVHPPVELLGGRTKRNPPQFGLLGGRRLADREAPHRPPVDRDPFAARKDQREMRVFRPARCARGFGIIALQQEDLVSQKGFPFPNVHQRFGLFRAGRDQIGAQRADSPTQPEAGRRRNLAAGRGIRAVKLNQRERFGFGRVHPRSRNLPGGGAEGRHGAFLRRERFDQPDQPVIQMRRAGEVMQNAFVDPQRALGERRTGADFHQTPIAQRRGGCERAPVRIRKNGQRQAEGRRRQRGERFGKTRIQFHAGAEQQDIPFKRREAKNRHQTLESEGRPVRPGNSGSVRWDGWIGPVRSCPGGGFKHRQQARQLPHQMALIGVMPSRRGIGVHEIVTCGAEKTG